MVNYFPHKHGKNFFLTWSGLHSFAMTLSDSSMILGRLPMVLVPFLLDCCPQSVSADLWGGGFPEGVRVPEGVTQYRRDGGRKEDDVRTKEHCQKRARLLLGGSARVSWKASGKYPCITSAMSIKWIRTTVHKLYGIALIFHQSTFHGLTSTCHNTVSWSEL